MTKALPSKLPECFRWLKEKDRRRLFLDDVEVLEVRQQRLGWVVRVHLNDSVQPHPVIVVRSIDAGMRWGARWSKMRAPQLVAMVAGRQRHAARKTVPSESRLQGSASAGPA